MDIASSVCEFINNNYYQVSRTLCTNGHDDMMYAEQKVCEETKCGEYINGISSNSSVRDIVINTYLLFPRHTSLMIQPTTSSNRDSVRFQGIPIPSH